MSDTPKSAEGTKHDTEKERWDLLPMGTLIPVVKILTFGAKKYGVDNWKKLADPLNRYFSAAMRHLVAYSEGHWLDICDEHWKGRWSVPRESDRPPDCMKCSGLPHLAHAICNLLFLLWFGNTPKKEEEPREQDPQGDQSRQ